MCRAYASASDDPVRGVNQRGPMFWGKVRDLFHEAHRKTCISIKLNSQPRTQEQIQTRWKALAKDMNVYFGHLKHIYSEAPSGVPEEQYVDLAIERYNGVEKKKFGKGLKECIPLLQKIVRFTAQSGTTIQHGLADRHVSPSQQDPAASDVFITPLSSATNNMAGSMMGSHLPRPIGTQRAREIMASDRRDRRARRNNEQQPQQEQEPPPDSGIVAPPPHTHQLTQVAQVAVRLNQTLNATLKHQFRWERTSKTIDLLMRFGRDDEAKALMDKLLVIEQEADEEPDAEEDFEEDNQPNTPRVFTPVIGTNHHGRLATTTTTSVGRLETEEENTPTAIQQRVLNDPQQTPPDDTESVDDNKSVLLLDTEPVDDNKSDTDGSETVWEPEPPPTKKTRSLPAESSLQDDDDDDDDLEIPRRLEEAAPRQQQQQQVRRPVVRQSVVVRRPVVRQSVVEHHTQGANIDTQVLMDKADRLMDYYNTRE
jgi:hypothetical protein